MMKNRSRCINLGAYNLVDGALSRKEYLRNKNYQIKLLF